MVLFGDISLLRVEKTPNKLMSIVETIKVTQASIQIIWRSDSKYQMIT